MEKIMVCKSSEIPDGKMRKFSIKGREILVANVGGSFYAVDDTCTHSGASLAEGTLDGGVVTCGWHGAQFDCRTGKLAAFPARIADIGSYRVAVESDEISVEI